MDAKTKIQNIDEYIAGFQPTTQVILAQLRETIRNIVPEAKETMSYQIPTFNLQGNLVHFAAFKNHIGFYPGPSAIAAFKNELATYESAKGTVKFPIDKTLPLALISRIVQYRVKENMEIAEAKKTRRKG
ncbi:iron chaperone [Pedobacter immunditicola]|uniref:iron chaperone n=1 Tax=Pedobacter immunditicola TaxID=3133440 RepID=UPI0030AA688B